MGPRKILGLAVDEKTIRVVELQGASGAAHLTQQGQFPVPAESGWDKPEKLGLAFAQFLKQNSFSARQAVVGLPGRWVLAKSRPIPPAAPETAIDILRLAVEREFHADAKEWAFDFAGQTSAKAKATILLAATPRARLTQIDTVLRQAGIRASAVTSTTLVLAETAGDSDAVLHLSNDGAELAIRANRRVVGIERLTVASSLPKTEGQTAAASMAAGEVRRALTLANMGPDTARGALTIWDTAGLEPAALEELSRQVGLPVSLNPDLSKLGLLNGSPPPHPQPPAIAGAVALAATGIARQQPAIDFLHSRLEARQGKRLARAQVLGIAAAAVIVLAGLAQAWDWYGDASEIGAINAELNANARSVDIARAEVMRLNFVNGWFYTRPPFLGCLRALTETFPRNGQVWGTNLVIRDKVALEPGARPPVPTTEPPKTFSVAGTISGKATDWNSVYELRDRLIKNKAFSKVHAYNAQQPKGQDVTFTINFVYTESL